MQDSENNCNITSDHKIQKSAAEVYQNQLLHLFSVVYANFIWFYA